MSTLSKMFSEEGDAATQDRRDQLFVAPSFGDTEPLPFHLMCFNNSPNSFTKLFSPNNFVFLVFYTFHNTKLPKHP